MMGLLFFFNENLSPSADQPDDLLISYMIDVIGVDFLVLLCNFFLAYLLRNIANMVCASFNTTVHVSCLAPPAGHL